MGSESNVEEWNMKRLACLTVASLCVALTLAGCKKAETRASPVLRQQARHVTEAWSTLDLRNVQPYYAADAGLLFFDLDPMKYTGWAEYSTGVLPIFADYQSARFVVHDDLQAFERDDSGWAAFTVGLDLSKKDGTTQHIEGRWTMVFEKRQGKWVVVHEHVSVPLPPPPATLAPSKK